MQFKNIQVTVGTKNIMATDASVSERNSVTPIYFIGHKRPDLYSPSGPLNNQIQVNYIVEPENDINHSLINEIRNYNLSSFPTRIVLGGITGAGYLNSYSINIEPNDIVTASATYNVFTPLTGTLSNQPNGINYNTGRGSGVAHSWTVFPRMASGHLTGSIVSLDYSFSPNWRPVYKVGNPNPVEVKFIDAEETFDIISEYDTRITYSGQTFTGKFNNIELVQIGAISGLWTGSYASLYLYPNSGRVISNSINIQENSIIVQNTSIIKNY